MEGTTVLDPGHRHNAFSICYVNSSSKQATLVSNVGFWSWSSEEIGATFTMDEAVDNDGPDDHG